MKTGKRAFWKRHGRVSFVLAVRGDLAPNNVQELVAFAKANPGKLTAASYGVGSTSHLGLATFEKLSGTEYTHVPFQGVAPAVNALIGGQVDLAFVNAYNVEQHRKSGKIKVLGVAGPQRLHTIADVPTMGEQGFPGFEAGNWFGFVTPKGVPRARARSSRPSCRRSVNPPPAPSSSPAWARRRAPCRSWTFHRSASAARSARCFPRATAGRAPNSGITCRSSRRSTTPFP